VNNKKTYGRNGGRNRTGKVKNIKAKQERRTAHI